MKEPSMDAMKQLIDYEAMLQAQIDEHRAIASKLAGKKRALQKVLTAERRDAIAEQVQTEAVWRVKSADEMKAELFPEWKAK